MGDLRAALRALTVRPAFTVVAVLTLALGIGANTAVFTVVRGVLLAPLPYHAPDEVVVLNEVSPQYPNPISVSWLNYLDWRDRSRSFETVAAIRTMQVTLSGSGEAERVVARQATTSLLPMLGVSPALGRAFVAEDDAPGAEGVVLLGHNLWQRRFGGDANIVGASIQIDQAPYTVIGVLPASFELFQPVELYVPLGPWAALLPDDRGWHPGILPVARLGDGVTIDQARADLESVSVQLEAEYPQFNRGVRARVTPIADQIVQNVRPALLMLVGAVSLVLLIACANVANLLLARAVDRQKEIAVRFALGAGRARLVRQLVVESVVLACAGGMAGALVAAWGVSALGTFTASLPRATLVTLDGTVLATTLGVSMLTGLIFGLVPALQTTRVDHREALNQDGRGAGSGGARHQRLRSALVVGEIALALVLLVGAGLLLRSFAALQGQSPGFQPAGLLVAGLPLSPVTYGDDSVRGSVVERTLERVRSLPGVTGATVATALPMAGGGAVIHFNITGRPPAGPEEYRMAGYRAVSPGYFSTLGIPLQRGRLFTDQDREGAPPVAIINESMARQYFLERDPVGQQFQIGTEPSEELPPYEIVGVVGDVRQSLENAPQAEYYLPYGQHPVSVLAAMYRSLTLIVRAAADPGAVAAPLRAAIREINPEQPIVNLRTMDEAIGATVTTRRMQMVLLAVFASVALALAVVGVYGVMAYAVSQRTQEIGVRMALGATASDVLGMVLRQAAGLSAAGLALGLIAAWGASRAVESLLFEVEGLDAISFGGAAALLLVAALAAAVIPAARAARVAPLVALGRSRSR